MEAKSSERRYNTRFRGVPRSIFTYSRSGKKSAKSNNENVLRTDIRDDFVYTKLGKKPSYERDTASPPKTKIKTETPVCIKQERKSSPKLEPKSNSLPNGTHKPSYQMEVSDNQSHKVEKTASNEIKKVPPLKIDKIPPLKLNKIPPLKVDKVVLPVNDQKDSPLKTDEVPHINNNNKKNNIQAVSLNKNNQVVSAPKNEIVLSPTPKEAYSFESEKTEEISPELSPKLEKEIDGIYFESKSTEGINFASNNDAKAVWITSKEKLSWNNCTVASYNPKTKMFRCVVCQAVGFMSRIGEHYLGTHCNAKVFHCPQCSYCSAWWRCVRNHMSKNHGVSNAPASMWKNQPLLDEIMQILQNLKFSVDCEDRVEKIAENCGKRYICPKCPYATDRRDLYNRHENIHREEKPFQCYICYKLFNRADHVKKHFCRIHKEFSYDINLIRRLPSKRSRIPVSPSLNGGSIAALQEMNDKVPKPFTVPVTQSHLLNCLTGSPTMVRVSREIDNVPELSEKEPLLSEGKNDNTFNKSHSNLLTFLTQNAFSPKPLPKQNPVRNTDPPVKDILQEALLKPTNFTPFQTSSTPKKFNCPYCPWTGPNPWALRIHTSMHYKTFCVLCNFKSSEMSDLENHMWECHKKRSCNKCNFLADSLLALDAHIKEAHVHVPQFLCRHCSQSFDVRSDMEAHSIFLHNQTLQECKENGCDFCTTDPDLLENHKKDRHSSSFTSQDPSASRTLCLYCGCDFADPPSLTLHEELFHENPLQKAASRPLNPYACSVCGYSTPKQPMMIEHMRIHSGQTLRCQAGDGCQFTTPYDTVLREHVLQSHSNDDGIVRCPHCGLRCSTRPSFVTHYKELHHPFCCQLCEDVEHKHFVSPFASYLDSSIKAMFPFAKKVTPVSNDTTDRPNDEGGRRSRKQMQPRKVVVQGSAVAEVVTVGSPKRKWSSSRYKEREKFISLYVKKVRKVAQTSVLKCRLCVKSPIYFRHKRNYILHQQWHCLKKYKCTKCIQTFSHRYQVLLHKKEHRETKSS
ncbi:protein charlatan [Caerostris darwini]|uniref:Protein charlatan n=1 Tax=Caerostris darwini TaxID=1538125 RepID=A0AAV4TJF8_9ARAC|nr:protein charlatan [Caerostris darwini]